MNIFWKGAAVLSLTLTGLGAATVPAQAHYDRGWRGERGHHWQQRRWQQRHWDNRRHWRDGRGYAYRSGYYNYRPRCWTEWRYDRWRDRDVRVRICR